MDQAEAIKKVKQYRLLLKNYFKIEKVYIFGSYVKNTFHEDSDIDVAIVVSQIGDDFFSVNPILWKLRRQVDDRIEPILIVQGKDDAGFLSEIQKHGIEIE